MLVAQNDTRALIDVSFAPLFQDHGLPLAVMGILVVFLALVLVVVFISLLPRVLARYLPDAVEPSAVTAGGEDELSDETLVVIAAAVAATLTAPHRIVWIRGLTPEDLGWSLEGRMQHHQSHRIQHRDHR